MTAIVEFAGVEKSYDGRAKVIEGLDLAVERGEFLTLLGPSGSGKTTTLMMLAGFEHPSHGVIRLNGRPIQDLAPHRRDIGMVFQNYALFPHMTVAENLAYPLKVRRLSRADIGARVTRGLDMVRLGGLADRKPAQLSGGQQQRVALARALVFQPELVLMDEPLGALDKNLREHMQFEIKHIHERLGVTVVYVTHDQGEALTMSTRIAVFNRGRIEQLAPPAEIYERPATAFVAGFIGENNALPGRVVGERGGVCIVALDAGPEIAVTGTPTAGTPVVVSLRPERLMLGEGRANRLEAEVAELIYLGDHLRVHLTGPGNQTLVAKLTDRRAIAVGEKLPLSFDPADAIALPVS